MKKAIFIILKFLLLALTVVFSFFNIVAGTAFINVGKVGVGVTLLALTILGYILATALVLFKKEIIAGALSLVASITLVAMKNNFIAIALVDNDIEKLYAQRHLPSVWITAIILIFAVIKLVKVIKEARIKKARKNREKAPSILD